MHVNQERLLARTHKRVKGRLLAGDPEAPPLSIDQDPILLATLAKRNVFAGKGLGRVGVRLDGFGITPDFAGPRVVLDADGAVSLVAASHQIRAVLKDGLEQTDTCRHGPVVGLDVTKGAVINDVWE